MTRTFALASLVCLALMLFAPGIANSATPATVRRTPPPTNTPRYAPQVALVPSLTSVPCPAEKSYTLVDSAGMTWIIDARPLCR